MDVKEWFELVQRMNSQQGVNWLWCTLTINGSWDYPESFWKHCVLHLLRRLDEATFGDAGRRAGDRLSRAGIFAKSPFPSFPSYYALCIELPGSAELEKFRQLISQGWSKSLQELKSELPKPPQRMSGKVSIETSFTVPVSKLDFANTHLPPAIFWPDCDCESCFEAPASPVKPKKSSKRKSSADDSLLQFMRENEAAPAVEPPAPNARMTWLEDGIFE